MQGTSDGLCLRFEGFSVSSLCNFSFFRTSQIWATLWVMMVRAHLLNATHSILVASFSVLSAAIDVLENLFAPVVSAINYEHIQATVIHTRPCWWHSRRYLFRISSIVCSSSFHGMHSDMSDHAGWMQACFDYWSELRHRNGCCQAACTAWIQLGSGCSSKRVVGRAGKRVTDAQKGRHWSFPGCTGESAASAPTGWTKILFIRRCYRASFEHCELFDNNSSMCVQMISRRLGATSIGVSVCVVLGQKPCAALLHAFHAFPLWIFCMNPVLQLPDILWHI